jgi:hypothetical protein
MTLYNIDRFGNQTALTNHEIEEISYDYLYYLINSENLTLCVKFRTYLSASLTL